MNDDRAMHILEELQNISMDLQNIFIRIDDLDFKVQKIEEMLALGLPKIGFGDQVITCDRAAEIILKSGIHTVEK